MNSIDFLIYYSLGVASMYCTKCGYSLPDNANFCLNCGSPQKDTITNQKTNYFFKIWDSNFGGYGSHSFCSNKENEITKSYNYVRQRIQELFPKGLVHKVTWLGERGLTSIINTEGAWQFTYHSYGENDMARGRLSETPKQNLLTSGWKLSGTVYRPNDSGGSTEYLFTKEE